MLGYHTPFRVGQSFPPTLSAPDEPAAIVHPLMALFGFAALGPAWPSFISTGDLRR